MPVSVYHPTLATFLANALRQFHRCQWCNRKVKNTRDCHNPLQATADHIVPPGRGGADNWSNLCVSCRECNEKKDRHDWGKPRFGPVWEDMPGCGPPRRVIAFDPAESPARAVYCLWLVTHDGREKLIYKSTLRDCRKQDTTAIANSGEILILPEGTRPRERKR